MVNIIMKIDEIFDSSYDLEPVPAELRDFINKALRADGYTSTRIFRVTNDHTQLFMLLFKDGAWEVHHTIAEPGKTFVSGLVLNTVPHANPKFIGTAIKLLKTQLDKSHRIRVVGPTAMWSTYDAAIRKLMKDNPAYAVEDPVEYTTHDVPTTSRIIQPRGKLECLTKESVPEVPASQ